MSIASIADKKTCGGSNSMNSGKLGCLSLFGTPAHFIAFSKGFRILPTEDFDIAFLTPLVQKGTATAIIDASAFEDVSSEDGYSSTSKGVKRLNVKGLPEYKLMFEEGHEFYRELAKMESYKSYDFMIGDENGNWIIATRNDGSFQGMSAGHVTPELTKRKVEGGDAESKSLLVQFLDRLQWDQNYSILHAEDLDFTPQELPMVNGTEIAFTVTPGDTDTVLKVEVTLASDRHTLIEGLESTDFLVSNGGTTPAISGVVEDTPGNYSLTIDTAVSTGDKVTISHWDSTLNVIVANSNEMLYRNVLDNEAVVA